MLAVELDGVGRARKYEIDAFCTLQMHMRAVRVPAVFSREKDGQCHRARHRAGGVTHIEQSIDFLLPHNTAAIRISPAVLLRSLVNLRGKF